MKVKLCEAFHLQMGKTPSRNEPRYWDGKNKWISIGDLSDEKYICKTKECISDAGVNESGIKIVPSGTVIMSFKLSIGKTAITTEDMYTNEAIMAFISNSKYTIDASYLYYQFCAKDWFVGSNKAVMGVTLNKATLSQQEIQIPVIEEQLYVATVLDKVSNLITLRKQQLAKLDELVKSRFIELFGDPIKNSLSLPTMPLGEACYLKAGITTVAEMIHEYSEEYTVPCYGGNGVRGYVKEATQNGNFPIIGRQGALCGNVQLATGSFHATEHAVLVTPLVEVNIVWLFHLLKQMDLYRYHTGAAQPGLAVKTLNKVDIPIANIAQQLQFAAFVEQTDKSKLTIQQSLDKLETLKKALMQQYFEGGSAND